MPSPSFPFARESRFLLFAAYQGRSPRARGFTHRHDLWNFPDMSTLYGAPEAKEPL